MRKGDGIVYLGRLGGKYIDILEGGQWVRV